MEALRTARIGKCRHDLITISNQIDAFAAKHGGNLPQERLFTTTNATSAASALGARMAAQLMAAYPALRPETIRALIVHSAEWTAAMRAVYLPAHGQPSKSDYVNLIRHCGWGVPSLERALWSGPRGARVDAVDTAPGTPVAAAPVADARAIDVTAALRRRQLFGHS